jgi:predicted component of type VI protein secretion system
MQDLSTRTLCFALAHLARAIVVSTLVVEHGVSSHRIMRTRASRDTSPRSKSPFNNMHHEQSTSAHGVDSLPSASKQQITEHIQIAILTLELRISAQNAQNSQNAQNAQNSEQI